MPRTTLEEVAAIIELDSSINLDPFIAAASALVDRLDVDSATAHLVETWLAAHFYTIRDPRTVSERAGSVGATYQSKVDLYLRLSHYGQMAITLDTSGGLLAISKGSVKANVNWLGTECGTKKPLKAKPVIGEGSPEGVIAAAPGTSYWDTLNKASWIKETGTGTTGWYQQFGPA